MEEVRKIYESVIKGNAFKIDGFVININELTEEQKEILREQEELPSCLRDFEINEERLTLKVSKCEAEFFNNRPYPAENLVCINYEKLPYHIVPFSTIEDSLDIRIVFSKEKMKVLTKGFGEFEGNFTFYSRITKGSAIMESRHYIYSRGYRVMGDFLEKQESQEVTFLPEEFLLPQRGNLTKATRN